ncbi:glycosyltransferase family 2 protein [Terriglobus roseus]|uniref:glycosyltransferase family 2 protein n=1 Tax=Terriglobus roseus TaxID=392734 RepID=UPI0012F6A2D3|nr:glycosyltransferase family 2 protein [Terriglobus roseus]
MIEVLLATYNGARFLREQIESVLSQEKVSVRILARDDGSNDGTQKILADYATWYPDNFRVVHDALRTGTARGNFGLLLQTTDADYAAFCDQDDVWLPNKLHYSMAAMRMLESRHGAHTPLLVYTDLRVVNERLQTVSDSLWQSNSLANVQTPSFAELLTENVVTGCTALLNRALIDRMKTMPATAQMHDHWAALIASSLGAMAAVPQPTVLYRQHASNVVGAIVSQSSFSAKVARFLSKEGVAARHKQAVADRAQARSLLELHGIEMPNERRKIVEGFLAMEDLSRIQRLRTTSSLGLWRPDRQRRIAQLLDLLRKK